MNSLRWLACSAPTGALRGTPAGTVVYAIGDIHGRIDLLDTLLPAIERHIGERPRRQHVVIFLGDYLSRGMDSRAVVERVLNWPSTLPSNARVIALKGNHEDLALCYLAGDLAAGRHWFDNDGLDALADYGVTTPDAGARDEATLLELRQRFAGALPQTHLAFFKSLAISHRVQDYHFVHAGVRPGVPLAEQTAFDQMWIRKRFLESNAEHGALVVHGHSISDQPDVHANRIGIDTGAYVSGVLTCLVLEGTRQAFMQVRGTPALAVV